MIPQSIEYTDPSCALLLAYIDRKTSGPSGMPVGGFRAIADAIGLEKRTVGIHAKHLAELGYIHLEMGNGPANKSARMWIKCNPGRTKCDHVHALPKEPRARSGSIYSGTSGEPDLVVRKTHHSLGMHVWKVWKGLGRVSKLRRRWEVDGSGTATYVRLTTFLLAMTYPAGSMHVSRAWEGPFSDRG